MAQNVTVAGASYTDVPSVELPKAGGGTASFVDVTDTTATADMVAEGYVFFDANGGEQTGTAYIPEEQTETVSASVSTGSSSIKENTVAFGLDEVKGITALSVDSASTTSAALIYLSHTYWENVVVGAGRATNASTSSTWSITGYQGNVDPNKTEQVTVTLNANTVTATFTNDVKCIKQIGYESGSRGYRRIVGISISGNVVTLTTVGSTSTTKTIEIYY